MSSQPIIVPDDTPDDYVPLGYDPSAYPDDPGDVEGTDFLASEDPE